MNREVPVPVHPSHPRHQALDGTADEQRESEKTIFRAFAEAASLSWTSIESRDPPEPDLLCEIVGVGLVAFELGIVASEALQRATSTQRMVRRQFQNAYAALPADDRLRIEERLGGVPAVFAGFIAGTPPGRWRRAVAPILEYLVTRARAGDGDRGLRHGDVAVWNIPTLSGLLTDMSVRRGTTKRPFLGVLEMVEVVDATLRMLEKKLAGRYTSEAPMELLLYWSAQPAPRTAEWRDDVIASIRARRATSRFRRVWCFDLFRPAVDIVEPPWDSR
jgi:hypothetical protein